MIHLMVEGSEAHACSVDGVTNLFICENEPLERILFNRRLTELGFVHACREASVLFLTHLAPLIPSSHENVSELMLLTKGYYYWLHNAYEAVFSRNLPISFIATNRSDVNERGVTVSVHFANLDAVTDTVIVGDTVASGETICAALETCLPHRRLQRLIVLSYAGTIVGAQRISAFCRANQIEVWFLYGLAAFGLAQNGFDLSFLHNQTATAGKYVDRARELYGDRAISVAGWDFGSQAQAPRKYHNLSRIEAHYWGMPDSQIFPEPAGPLDSALVRKEHSAFSARAIDLSKIE